MKRAAGLLRAMRVPLLVALLVAIVVSVAYLALREAPAAALDGQTLDWRFRLRGEETPGKEVLLVAVDDRAVAAAGRWPVPRQILADAVRSLIRGGARVIAFDLLFADPEAGGGDGDRDLAAALREAGMAVVPFAFVFAPNGRGGSPAPYVARSAYRIYRLPDRGRLSSPLAPSGLIAPVPAIGEAAAGIGHVSVVLNADGSLRYDRTAIVYGEDLYPSLSIEAVRLFLGLPREAVAVRFGEEIAIGALRLAVDQDMRLAVNHYGPRGTFPTVSLAEVLAGTVPTEAMAGRIVLIGATATGAGDNFITPFSRALPGPEHFATVIDNILRGRPLIDGQDVLALDLLAIFLGAGLAALVASPRRPIEALAGAAAVLAAWGAVAFEVFAHLRIWLNGVFPTLAILLTLALMTAIRLVAERRLLRDAERRSALRAPCPRRGLSRRQRATWQGYGTAGGGDVHRHGRLHQSRRAPLAARATGPAPRLPCPHRSGGHGAWRHHRQVRRRRRIRRLRPRFAQPGRRRRGAALRASACYGCSKVGEERAAAGLPPPTVSIGVHYGPVVVGDIGSLAQRQFTVSGDTVNVASRLEALTRGLGAVIIASDAAVDCARAAGAADALAGFIELPPQPIRGRARPVGVWAWSGERAATGGDERA